MNELKIKLTPNECTWLELLDGPQHWDLKAVRLYSHGYEAVSMLRQGGLLEIREELSWSDISITPAGRKTLVQLKGACGSCEGDGWECRNMNCKSDHKKECASSRTCSWCLGKGY